MLDARTLQALEFSKVLQHLAGYCVSEAGKDACLTLMPFSTAEAVHEAAALCDDAQLWRETSGFALTSFPTMDGVFRYMQSQAAVLDLDALWALRRVLSQARRAHDSIAEGVTPSRRESRWARLAALSEKHPLPFRSVSGLERCVSDDGMLRDESSPELLLVRGEIRRIHQQCIRKVKDFAQQYNILHYLQDEFMTLSSDRYVLPLKASFKGRLQGIIHDYSQTGETCYFEPMFLVEINNRLQELKREERSEERKVLMYLTSLVRGEFDGVKAACALLVEIDILLAKQSLGKAINGTLVSIDDDAALDLRGARHPLLLLAGHDVQPVDISLARDQRGLVISGGNAGGKTVCLKTAGLIVLMALAALPVPVASGSALPPWFRVHAFIGDEQSLEDHVSTFTAQITHLGRVWEKLDRHTLVILDEFGAGTDPAQGAALAQAVLDELMEHGASVIAATHFPALKAYALSRDGVRAASVLFDPSTRKPLFSLAYDQVGASQALDVAREHGLPENVLRRAEHYLLLDGEDTTMLIDRLNSLAVARERELTTLRAEEARFKARRAKLEERFEKERKDLFADVQGQAQSILKDWKSGKSTSKQALKELGKVREGITAEALAAKAKASGSHEDGGFGTQGGAVADNTPSLDVTTLLVGQAVFHRPWGKTASVLEVDLRKKRVRIDMNGVALWANASDLTLKGEVAKPKTAVTHKVSSSIVPMRLDLRGMRADVALSELERFIDKALLAGMHCAELVHGRGTGALRKEVHTYLRQCPVVATFALAPEDQGGDGMTVVEFR
ncbi:MAG: Smr/MutS family protein [Pseudomonadota bacterium]